MPSEALEELARIVAERGNFVSTEEDMGTGVVANIAASPSDDALDMYREMDAQTIQGYCLERLQRYDPEAAADKWEEMRQAAREELASGWRASQASLSYNSIPMDRARFLALRESLAEEWQPRGAIELSLIEQMATAQTHLWEWTRYLSDVSERTRVAERLDLDAIGHQMGEWKRLNCNAMLAPRISDSEDLEQAFRMVSRWNALYLRILRQLRDLRRYSGPVVVNQGGQVNIGEKQINVSQGERAFAEGEP